MTNLINLDAILAKFAKEQAKSWHFSKEWRTAIIVSMLAKMGTMVVSMGAGWYFFHYYALGYFQDWFIAMLVAVILLLLLELGTAITLSKFFKFLFHKKFVTAITCLLVMVFLFYASFQASTNGMAMRQSNQVDNSEGIKKAFAQQIAAIQNDTLQISEIHQNIARIEANPQGWQGHKRVYLTTQQLAEIRSLREDIKQIRADQKVVIKGLEVKKNTTIAANSLKMSETAAQYYSFASWVMVAQIILNAFLMFAWVKIYNENEAEEVLTTEIVDITNHLKGQISKVLTTQLIDVSNTLEKAVLIQDTGVNSIEYKQQKGGKKQIGFQTGDSTKLPVGGSREPYYPSEKTPKGYKIKCDNCGEIAYKKRDNARFCCDNCRRIYHNNLHASEKKNIKTYYHGINKDIYWKPS